MRHDVTTSLLAPLTPTQFADLSKNEYMRYYPSSDVIGHIVIVENPRADAPPMAMQFALPDGAPESPFVVDTLTDLALISLGEDKTMVAGKYGNARFVSRRSYRIAIQVDGNEPDYYTHYPLSPTKNPLTKEERPILYDASSIKRENDTAEARAKFANTPKRVKESDWLEIKNADVRVRMDNPRSCEQSKVMGLYYAQEMGFTGRFRKSRTAKEEVKDVLQENRDYFSLDMVSALEGMANAPFRYAEAKDPNYFQDEKQSYPEWLHRDAHNLHPLDKNPQREDNLGAAEMRCNTAMMIGERTLQFFALNVPISKNAEKCKFDMLLHTQVIDHIHFVIMTQIGRIKITLAQHIDPFPKCPQNTKPSDLAGFIAILHCLIQNTAPTSRQSVNCSAYAPNIQRHRLVGSAPQPPRRPILLLEDTSEDDIDETHPSKLRRLEATPCARPQ